MAGVPAFANGLGGGSVANLAFTNKSNTFTQPQNFTDTGTQSGAFTIASSNTAKVMFGNGGPWFTSPTFAVPFITPATSGQSLNFDMFPCDTANPTTAVYSSYFDIVDRDIRNGGTAALSLARWLHMGINSNGYGEIDINRGGTSTNIPLVIGRAAIATGIGFFGINEVPFSFFPLQVRLATDSNFGFLNRNDSTTNNVTTAELRTFNNTSSSTYIPMALKSFSRIYLQTNTNVNLSLVATGASGALVQSAISDNNSTLIQSTHRASAHLFNFNSANSTNIATLYFTVRGATDSNLSWGQSNNTLYFHNDAGTGRNAATLDAAGFTFTNSATSLATLSTAGTLALQQAGGGLSIKQGTNGRAGDATLVAGVATITIAGLTTSDRAIVNLTTIGGTLGSQYRCVCTANTLTITSLQLVGTTQTLDTSTLFYFIVGAS